MYAPAFPVPNYCVLRLRPDEVSFPADWAGCEARATAWMQHLMASAINRPGPADRRKPSNPVAWSLPCPGHSTDNGQLPSAQPATGADRMVKILSGLVAAIVIAAGGFFGFQFYTQHRIASEVEAALRTGSRRRAARPATARSRSTCCSRTVTIADIAAQSAAQPPVSVKIGSLTAVGRQSAGCGAILRRDHRNRRCRDRRGDGAAAGA